MTKSDLPKWLNYNHLYYFWIVLSEGSFTGASQRLHVSQSSISQQVKELELRLGVRLFERAKRQTPRLTEEGKVVAEYAKGIFESAQEMLDYFDRGQIERPHHLRVGCLSGLSRNFQYRFLEPALSEPGFQFDVVTGDHAKLMDLMAKFELDVILSTSPGFMDLKAEVYAHLLSTSPFCVATSARRNRLQFKPQLFRDHKIVIPSSSSDSRAEIDAFFDSIGVTPQVLGEVDDIALLRLFATRTSHLVFIPKIGIQNEIEAGEVKVLHIFRSIEQRYYALTRQKRFSNPTVARLISEFRGDARG